MSVPALLIWQKISNGLSSYMLRVAQRVPEGVATRFVMPASSSGLSMGFTFPHRLQGTV